MLDREGDIRLADVAGIFFHYFSRLPKNHRHLPLFSRFFISRYRDAATSVQALIKVIQTWGKTDIVKVELDLECVKIVRKYACCHLLSPL